MDPGSVSETQTGLQALMGIKIHAHLKWDKQGTKVSTGFIGKGEKCFYLGLNLVLWYHWSHSIKGGEGCVCVREDGNGFRAQADILIFKHKTHHSNTFKLQVQYKVKRILKFYV